LITTTSVGELYQRFVCPRQVGAAASDKVRIDVNLAHVVDDHRDATSLAIAQHVVEDRRLAGAEKSRQYGYRKPAIAHRPFHAQSIKLRVAA
jgi:hypothetical protein